MTCPSDNLDDCRKEKKVRNMWPTKRCVIFLWCIRANAEGLNLGIGVKSCAFMQLRSERERYKLLTTQLRYRNVLQRQNEKLLI